MKRLVRAGDAGAEDRLGGVTQKTESPRANCGEWAAGGWSQLFGLGGEPSQEAPERGVLAARGPVQRLPLQPGGPSTGEQARSSEVPYEGRLLARSVLQGRGRGGLLRLRSLSHTGGPNLWGCAEAAGGGADAHPWRLVRKEQEPLCSWVRLSGLCFPLRLSWGERRQFTSETVESFFSSLDWCGWVCPVLRRSLRPCSGID